MRMSPEKKYPLLAILLLTGFFSIGAVPVGPSFRKSIPGLTEIYISPKGSDNNSGTKGSPLKSLVKAVEMSRSARKSSPGVAVTIFVEDGTYLPETSIEFSAEDSGDEKHPFLIRAAENAKPVFKGGRLLKNWSLLEKTEKLKVLQGEVKGKIFVSNVKEAGITNYGDPIEPGKRPDLYCNGQLQTLARWPNSGFTRAGSIKGATEMPPTYLKKRGTREGVFEYLDERQKKWANEKDGCVGGYWYFDWSDQFHKISRVDTVSKILRLAEPYHVYGYKDSLRYFGVNLFCEIDQPGEWYLDRAEGILYWYPPVGVDPGKAEVSLSLFDDPFMMEIKECSYLTLEGLSFVESRGSALSISGGTNCLVRDCRMERFGRDGIHIDGGSGHGISGCLIRTLGYSGIGITGGDRKNLTPANHFVDNTIVEHFSMFKRTYEPAIYLVGCGMRVSNNRFRYSSSSAMRLEGNDFTIEYNDISEVVNESDDQGALDMWYDPSYRGIMIRYNRWSDISGGTHSGAAGVRLDDMISGATIYGNIFERCGARHFGGVQIHGGKDNLVENNLFYKCNGAVSFSLWGEKRWLEQLDTPVITKKIYDDVDIRSSLYTNKYPELKTIREKADFNTVKNNLVVDCLNQFLRNNDRQIFENNPVLPSGGKSPEAFCSPEILRQHGLQPIPLEKMGPKNNRWDK